MLRPMHPVERLLNLTALLLESSRPLTFAQIRERIPAYGQREVDTAKRMFERDKDLLRETGIPIELVPTDPGHEHCHVAASLLANQEGGYNRGIGCGLIHVPAQLRQQAGHVRLHNDLPVFASSSWSMLFIAKINRWSRPSVLSQ